jgi:hypothetical protein
MERIMRARKLLRDMDLARVDALSGELQVLADRLDRTLCLASISTATGLGADLLLSRCIRTVSERIGAMHARRSAAQTKANAACVSAALIERLAARIRLEEARTLARRELNDLIDALAATDRQASHKDAGLDGMNDSASEAYVDKSGDRYCS